MSITLKLDYVVLYAIHEGGFKYQAAGFLSYFDAQQWARLVSNFPANSEAVYDVVRVSDGLLMGTYRQGLVFPKPD